MDVFSDRAVLVTNARGASPFVITCDHASNRLPPRFGTLGLTLRDRVSPMAWDPGALAVCRVLSASLDAPLLEATFSRLVIDPNRAPDAPDLIRARFEATEIAGNRDLPKAERQFRIDHYHRPYHAAIETLLEARRHAGRETILVCIHSATPGSRGVTRPSSIGIVHGADAGFSLALADALRAERPEVSLGWSPPQRARAGATLTLERHGDARGLEATMIALRIDEVLTPSGVAGCAAHLANSLVEAFRQRHPAGQIALPQRSGWSLSA